MKKTTLRLISLLLAMVMALTMAAPVMAADLSEDDSVSVAAQETDVQAADTEDAESGEDPSQGEPQDTGSDSQEPGDDQPSTQEQTTDAPVPAQAQSSDAAAGREKKAASTLSPLTLKVLKTAKLTVEGAVSYESSDSAVVTVDSKGVVAACHTGSAEIQVTTEVGTVLTCAVTVPVTTTTTEAALTVGGTTTLKLKNRKLEQVVSSNPKVAAVDDKGVVTAKKSGVADLTLTDTLGDIHICTIKVKGVLRDKQLSVSEEKSVQLTLQGSDIVSARSSDESVATVGKDGTVTGVKEGNAVVTLTDDSGSTAKCKVTVEPNYLARTAKHAKRIYRKIETLRCRHVSGVNTYTKLLKTRHCSCTTGPSLSLQAAGVLPEGRNVTHTPSGSERRKLRDPDKAIAKRKNLIKGTYTLYRANCRYSRLPAKYKQAGMVYVQDSNICVSAGNGYIYSCNESPSQYRHGHYYNTRVKSGYTHRHKILYVIAPNS